MTPLLALAALPLLALGPTQDADQDAGTAAPEPMPQPMYGPWDAWLESPGGRLRFRLVLEKGEGGPVAALVNGVERIEVPHTALENGELVLDFPHYDSRVTAAVGPNGASLAGTWRKRRSNIQWTSMTFGAAARPPGGMPGRPDPAAERVAGRWAVDFSNSRAPAVGVFRARPDGGVVGTFLTTLGDYRYLAGRLDDDVLELSCFDGAHAFLFRATLGEDGTLAGDFWSGDRWHETWTAARDGAAALPDAFAVNRVRPGATLAGLAYRDLDGETRDLGDPAFAGRARIVQLFGTWCPNCNDEAPFLAELHERYADRGLSIVGLAFEVTGDVERDLEQLRRYRDRWDVGYPLLLAGTANKASATRAFPYLDRVVAYPTTIFLDGAGTPRAIHTGFSGPATGAEHERLKERFVELVEELLAEDAEGAR